MENISIIFQISFGEIISLMVALMTIWITVLGYQLYGVFKEENPNSQFEDWARSKIGKKYLKIALIPIVPIVVGFVILMLPIVMLYSAIEQCIARLKK